MSTRSLQSQRTGRGAWAVGAGLIFALLVTAVLPTAAAQAAAGTWSPTGTPLFSPGLPTVFQGGCDECADIPVLGPQLPVRLGNGMVLAIMLASNGTQAELYDPAANAWSLTGKPIFTPELATLLANGKVLAVSGTSAELYDPAARAWKATGSPIFAPNAASLPNDQTDKLTLLPNGKVLAMSGTSAELYDPISGTWARTTSEPLQTDSIGSGTQTLLPNGKVLVAGGCCVFCDSCGFAGTDKAIRSAELYDPATGTWSPTAGMNGARFEHTATLLANGKVLVGGGMDGVGAPCCTTFAGLWEIYDPVAGTWSVAAIDDRFESSAHSATLLSDGNVLLLDALAQAVAVYHPATNTLTTTGSTPPGAGLGLATAGLANGNVLVSGSPPQVYTPQSAPLPLGCTLSAIGIDATGHGFIDVAAQDISSGLSSVQVVQATNAAVFTPSFPLGSRDPAVFTATKVVSTERSTLTLKATNMAGQSLTCDPVVAQLVRERDESPVEVFRDLPRAESKVSLSNGSPGLQAVTVVVNGRRFRLKNLQDGQVRRLDVASAMEPGRHNTILVIARGKRESSALLVIGD